MKVSQSCPTLHNPMDYTVHGIIQARILEWVVVPFYRGSSQPKDQTQVSLTESNFFTNWATRKAQEYWRRDRLPTPVFLGFPGSSDGKESTCKVGNLDSIPGLGRSPGGGHGNSLQYSCLENPHGQRSLVGCSPRGHKESDMTERLSIAQSESTMIAIEIYLLPILK